MNEYVGIVNWYIIRNNGSYILSTRAIEVTDNQ